MGDFVGFAEPRIRAFNGYAALAAADFLLREHIPNVEAAFQEDRVAANVVLVDGLWAAGLGYQFDTTETIIASLGAHAHQIVESVTGLANVSLEEEPDQVYAVAVDILGFVFDAPAQMYVFGAKFLHWCSRSHFPIVDRRARRAISHLQQAGMLPDADGNGVIPPKQLLNLLDDYRTWIRFYSAFIGTLCPEQRDQLRELDWSTLPVPYRGENSLLRILDKVFYAYDRGMG
ncbi:MAG TPA: hypothetical protein VNA25_30595 [Phycisphaerae bacterium]|nr:hypothetical protein [Phycisphaerae bacterium]